MKKVVIVGGGIAGLTSAVYLAEKGIHVTLLEASPKLGGRTYSIYSNKQDDYYDNGQHILMGCYDETILFLKKINSFQKLLFPKSLEINFVSSSGENFKLKSPPFGYPLNHLVGILGFKALTLKERLRVLDFFLDLMCCFDEDLKDITVMEWLKSKKQSNNTVNSFWEIIVVGALNTTVEKASAEVFAEILKRIFLDGKFASTILLPGTNLSELFCRPAEDYLISRNGLVELSNKVTSVKVNDGIVSEVITDKKNLNGFDAVIFSIPLHALEKIEFENSELRMPEMKLDYSPIVNVHLWLKENSFKEKFYGLIGSDVHWLFNHGKHITLTSSSAEELVTWESNRIVGHFCSELEKYFHIFKKESVIDSIVLKEKRATFVPNIESNEIRNKKILLFKNMFIAGDWTSTGLPSTIESAALSGRLVAENVLSFLVAH